MFLRKDRPALGRKLVALLAVVIVVVGAFGIYLTNGVTTHSPTSTTASSNTSVSSSTSTPTSTTSASSSSSSSTVTTTSSASTAPPFVFSLTNYPDTILISPGATLTYASVNILTLPSAQSSGSELVRLNVTVPNGIYLRFARNPVNVSLDSQEFAIFTLSAAPNIAPGDYKIAVVGTSGSLSENGTFTVRVTQNLIIINNKVFSPANLTVKVGSTVYWINLDPATNGDDERDTDVVFNAVNVQSSVLYPSPVYSSFSYTFTKAGDYYYHSSMLTFMNGEIVVTG